MEENKSRVTREITLSDMIRGIQYCVNASSEIAQQHYFQMFQNFLKEDGSLITQKIRISDTAQMEIPLICMSGHSSLDFEEMRIKMDMNIRDIQKKEFKIPFGDETEKECTLSRGSLSVALGEGYEDNHDSSHAQVEMVFKRGEPPEAVSRLIDNINNAMRITPAE